ncbi:hypothetical protein QG37_07215 [Candidozyma auris]|uniref:Uncharacterized protein n=1 Tax=Candidozyma auris TaxID=498019 RepID=A0A0L0NQY4_CANAR|nr:hypothetical protein QG37_07215 [[Candida] auris]
MTGATRDFGIIGSMAVAICVVHLEIRKRGIWKAESDGLFDEYFAREYKNAKCDIFEL